ncbi:cytochrome bd oxidase small subunit CydS [Oceanobacillus locisalsi]|uniref:Uncharacterized protein n=1 Tax=Oceanobacillus locisalsi TaxID=546107 RepID=A0ABW3NDR2_9BACI
MLNQFLIFVAPFIILIAAIIFAFIAAAKDR